MRQAHRTHEERLLSNASIHARSLIPFKKKYKQNLFLKISHSPILRLKKSLAMDGYSIGKWLVLFGIGLILLGGLFWVFTKMGLPLGKLPGDISYQKGQFRIYFPLVTGIVISIVLTILINFILWIFRK